MLENFFTKKYFTTFFFALIFMETKSNHLKSRIEIAKKFTLKNSEIVINCRIYEYFETILILYGLKFLQRFGCSIVHE